MRHAGHATSDTLISCELLGDLPARAAERWRDRAALTFHGRSWSYQQFDREVDTIASALASLGVGQGDKVAIWLPNGPEIEFVLFAVAKVGAIAVPLNTRYKPVELSYALEFSGSTVLIACARSGPVDLDSILVSALGPSRLSQDGTTAFAAAPLLKTVIMIGETGIPGALAWADFQATGARNIAALKTPLIRASDPVMMMFTSGTTANPKAVLLDHAGMRLCHDRAQLMELTPDDVQLTYLPLFHIYSIGYCVLMSFISGASQVLMDAFQAAEALRLIEQHRVSVIHGFEAHFSDLLTAQARASRDISSLRTASFATGADSMIALAEKVQDNICVTAASYGLTEMWGGFTISPSSATRSQRCETSGPPQDGIEVRIADFETGEILPPGQVGEIEVRSYARFIGYFNDPDATANAVDKNGWFRTGDAGLLRGDGNLKYVARRKDMLKVGGENVAPAEVESLLGTIRGVASVAVVGKKDERLQEVPVAFIVASGDQRPKEEDIIGFCRGKIASFKIPRQVMFIDEMPMTSTGKIKKEELRNRLRS